MKKISTTNSTKNWSSYWLGSDIDTSFKDGSTVDYTKLAAAQRAIGNFVNIVTGKQIPVVFQSNDSSYTDGDHVVIGTKLDDKNFDPAVGLALHEGSHIAYTNFKLFKTTRGRMGLDSTLFAQIAANQGLMLTHDVLSTLKDLLNWIEDRRIDYKVYTTAPGYRLYYEAMYNKYFNDKIIDKALLAGEMSTENIECYMFHIINFTNVNRKLDALKELRRIWNVIDLKNINRLNSTEDALNVAIEVYKIINSAVTVNDELQPDPDAQSNNETDISTNPESDPNESDDTNPGTQSTDASDDNETDKQSTLTAKEQEKLRKAIQSQRDFIRNAIKKQGRLTKPQSSMVAAIREAGTEIRDIYTNEAADGNKISTVVIKKLTPAIICSLDNLFLHHSEAHINQTCTESVNENFDCRQQVIETGLRLGRQLGNKLQLRNSDRSLKSTRLQTGKIDKRLVNQLGYNNVNVFHRIVTNKYKNYFIHISIDASGSMSGQKLNNALISAIAIAQAASMTTGIRVQISFRGTANIGTSTEKCVTLYAYDSAHDKINKIRTYFKYIDVFGCTPEGLAFKSIEKDILRDAKGDELIFINYSDGAPTNLYGVGANYNGVSFTRRVINNFRSNNINIISYFIHDSYIYDRDRFDFISMYGSDSNFINAVNMLQISKTMNSKFLEIEK